VEALKTNLGHRAVIKGLVSHDDLEIQDLDSVTTDSEVECYIKSALGLPDTSIRVKNIRPAYAGTQRSTVRLKSTDALKLAKKARIKIGWINVRVRQKYPSPDASDASDTDTSNTHARA